MEHHLGSFGGHVVFQSSDKQIRKVGTVHFERDYIETWTTQKTAILVVETI